MDSCHRLPALSLQVLSVTSVCCLTVGAELVNGRILDELLDLVSDEIVTVRIKAVEALIQMCDVFESSVRCSHILPMLKQLCRQTPGVLVISRLYTGQCGVCFR